MKQASPAQLAARAKFAAAARSGAFKRKTKPATKRASPARKRNPVGPKDGPGAEYFVKVKGRGWVREFARNATPDRWRYSRSFADAQVFSEGQAVSIKTMCDHVMAPCELMEVREANPKGRKAPKPGNVRAVDMLPTYYPKGRIAVHLTTTGGKPGALLAEFPRKADAMQYARAYADSKGRSVLVVGRE